MSPTTVPLRLLLVTRRDALASFFGALPGVALVAVLADAPADVDDVDVACIDVALEPDGGLGVCAAVHALRPALPLVAIVCCPQAVSPWQLERLVETGVLSVLDFQASAREV